MYTLYYINVGYKAVFITQTCYHDAITQIVHKTLKGDTVLPNNDASLESIEKDCAISETVL